MNRFRPATPGLAICACLGLLAGCATTQMNSQWKNPAFTGGMAKGSRVMVMCQARDDTLRRVCEDQWVVQLGAHGINTVRGYTLTSLPPSRAANPDEIKTAAKASGARAVISMQLTASDVSVVNPGPQLGVGIGGGSGGYHGGGFSFGGLGVSFPVGSATVTQGMASSTTLVDVASGALVWSGNASTAADVDITAQVTALTRVTAEELKKAGVF